jgi:cytidine deaminase
MSRSKEISFTYSVASSLDELNESDRKLFSKALDVLQNAYAPYSQFKVGSALMMEDGTIITGTNQENIAYPSGLCAERVAIFSAASNNPGKKIAAIAVAAQPLENENATVTPCGACRQVMIEYERTHPCYYRLSQWRYYYPAKFIRSYASGLFRCRFGEVNFTSYLSSSSA